MTGPVCLHDDCEDNDVDGVLLCFQSGMGMMGAQQGMMPPTYQQAMVSTHGYTGIIRLHFDTDFSAIDPSHESYNAFDKYPTIHHFCFKLWIWKWCIVGFVLQV